MGGSFLLRAPLCLQPSLGALFDRRASYATETVIAVDGVAHTILRFWGPMAQNPNRIWTFGNVQMRSVRPLWRSFSPREWRSHP
jgi:hypothetical protein